MKWWKEDDRRLEDSKCFAMHITYCILQSEKDSGRNPVHRIHRVPLLLIKSLSRWPLLQSATLRGQMVGHADGCRIASGLVIVRERNKGWLDKRRAR